jgi:hypothetical protein
MFDLSENLIKKPSVQSRILYIDGREYKAELDQLDLDAINEFDAIRYIRGVTPVRNRGYRKAYSKNKISRRGVK